MLSVLLPVVRTRNSGARGTVGAVKTLPEFAPLI
jgi:hypothetical protein